METVIKNSSNSNKVSKYPVIYSYIYERESEDIKKLYNAHKAKPKKRKILIETRTITGFKIENGKAVAIFKEETNTIATKIKKGKK
jgi:hypothetical protein